MTKELAFAASLDAGNRAMWAGGRKAWSVKDMMAAQMEYQRLWPMCIHGVRLPECCEETHAYAEKQRRNQRRREKRLATAQAAPTPQP
jgi:hypothetical protein